MADFGCDGARPRHVPLASPARHGQDALTPTARRLGVASGAAVALLCLAYASVLSVGLLTLPSPDHPIQPPWFTWMETLIIGISPATVALTVALHARAQPDRKPLALAAVAFMSMSAGVTSALHFAILTLSGRPEFAGAPWQRLVFSFEWPSVAYVLDIVAWDVFFPLAALFAAPTVHGAGLARVARGLLFASAALAFLGLVGVPLADMQVRNFGILGYAVLFPIAAGVLALVFHRAGGETARPFARAHEPTRGGADLA